MELFFMIFLAIYLSSLERVLLRTLAQFKITLFVYLLSFTSSLQIVDSSLSSSYNFFCKHFLPLWFFFQICLDFVLHKTQVLNLRQVQLFSSSSMDYTFGVYVLFESIFVQSISLHLSSFFWYMDIQLFQHHLPKGPSLLHCVALASLQRSVDYIYVGLFLGSSLFHWSVFSFANRVPRCPDSCCFIVSLEVGQHQSCDFVFQLLTILGFLPFHVNLRINL